MKAKGLVLSLVAIAATLMSVSCGKEDIELNDNELVYDGTVYQAESHASTDGSYVMFELVNPTFTIEGMLDEATLNKTLDIAKHNPGAHYYVSGFTENLFNFGYDNWAEGVHGGLDGTDYENESIFSEGTMTSTFDGTKFTMSLKGTLKNGKEIAFKIRVDEVETLQRSTHTKK